MTREMTRDLTYRLQLLDLAAELEITDEEAGEREWQQYLSDSQLADAIRELRPAAEVPAQE